MQEKLYGKSITVADREMVEEKANDILSEAKSSDVAFLVVGDPFGYFTISQFLCLNLFKSCNLYTCIGLGSVTFWG